MRKGRKSRFHLKDLDGIPGDLKAIDSRAPLLAALKRGNTQSSTYLLVATLRSFGGSFFAPVIPRLALLLATFAQPLLLKNTLVYMSTPEAPDSKGWAIFGGFICIYGSMVLSNALYREKLYAITVKYRGALVGAIYVKTLRLASHVSRPLGAGIGSNYMSVDVERIGLGVEEFHEIWAAVAALPLAFALLYSEANWAAFLPLVVVTIALGATSALAKQAGDKQTQWSQKTDERIKFMSSSINQLLSIKIFAYESYISRKADALRNIELRFLKKFFIVAMITATISNSLQMFTLFVVIGVYAAVWGQNGSGLLDVSKIFTIYSIVQLLSGPFNVLGQSLPSLLAAYSSMKRLEKFFLFDEKIVPTIEQEGIPPSDKPAHPERGDISLRGSFSWDKEGQPVLHDVDIQIPAGKLTICAGPVAAGKTSLVMALMGELHPISEPEKSYVPSFEKIGYTGQEAFIMPGTLRDNILFGLDYDQTFYDKVVQACALDVDFARMVSGDQTRVTGAKTLSGGQKQRIALARAVYSQASLVLLDDPFSALDGHTASYVFQQLFGSQGLLKNRTVLLITHYVHHLPSADYVLILEKGAVAYRGTWNDVQDAGYRLSELARVNDKAAAGEIKDSSQKDVKSNEPNPVEIIENEYDAVDAVDQEANNPYIGGMKPYIFWFRNGGILYSVIAMIGLLLVPTLMLANQGYLKEWSESDGSHYPQWIGGLAAFSVSYFTVILLVLYFYSCMLVTRIGESVHANELRGLFHATISWIHKNPSGKLISRFSQDIFEIDFTFPLAFLNGGISVWGLIGTLIIIYASSPWLAISAPFMLAAYLYLLRFYLASSKQLQQLEAASKTPLYTVFGTTLSGLEVIRAYRADQFFLGQNDKHLDASQGPFHFRFAAMRFLITTLTFMTFLVAVGLTGTVIGLRRSSSVSLLGMALSQLTGLTQQLSHLLMSLAIVENGTVSLARLQEVIELPSETDGETLSVVSKKAETWPSQGSVVFNNVQLRYGEELPQVLKGISFSVKPGMRVGICGRTGSGKSSTVQALFRAVDSSLIQGKITIDSVDISGLPLRTLRDSLSIVTQEPFLWYDTIRNNLDVEGRKSDEDVWAALEQVGLKNTFSKYPLKLETMIEDSGSFSRGERQLLCLARVLIRSRRIVVLDEATSATDLETDDRIRRVIEKEMKNCTVIAVAHRIATIIDFDLIIVLDDGVIVESGSPHELLANGGRFARLAASQGITEQT